MRVSKFLLTDSVAYRNYRGVFGRAEGERVLQFPSYSFDVSVMNIWDTFAVRPVSRRQSKDCKLTASLDSTAQHCA